jgi:hypothetical protein
MIFGSSTLSAFSSPPNAWNIANATASVGTRLKTVM